MIFVKIKPKIKMGKLSKKKKWREQQEREVYFQTTLFKLSFYLIIISIIDQKLFFIFIEFEQLYSTFLKVD